MKNNIVTKRVFNVRSSGKKSGLKPRCKSEKGIISYVEKKEVTWEQVRKMVSDISITVLFYKPIVSKVFLISETEFNIQVNVLYGQ